MKRINRLLPVVMILSFPCAAFLAAGCGHKEEVVYIEGGSTEAQTDLPGKASPAMAASPTPEPIYVDVQGYVQNPGVYALPENSRVYQAVEAAGGPSAEGRPERLNMARLLSDGEQVCLPGPEDAPGGPDDLWSGPADGGSQRININTAGPDELKTLTGIGDAKAAAIVRYRENNGPFTSVEDLMQVEGIKEGTFANIKDEVTVR